MLKKGKPTYTEDLFENRILVYFVSQSKLTYAQNFQFIYIFLM